MLCSFDEFVSFEQGNEYDMFYFFQSSDYLKLPVGWKYFMDRYIHVKSQLISMTEKHTNIYNCTQCDVFGITNSHMGISINKSFRIRRSSIIRSAEAHRNS